MVVPITALYAALLALLYAALGLKVAFFRKNRQVSLGDGGDKQARQLIRAHGNAGEYIPLVLILMGCYELNGGSGWLLHVAGGLFFLARMLHAQGLILHRGPSPERFIGASLTFVLLIGLAAANLLLILSNG